MKKPIRSLLLGVWRSLWLTCLFAVLTACTGFSQTIAGRAFHSLSFDPSRESVGVQLLYYRYGATDQFGLRTPPDQVASGKAAGVAITGELPIGDDFYAKWRVLPTGQVFEDTVDLKSRLPSNMHRQTLKPIIEGSQLYVYLISYDPVRPFFTHEETDLIDANASNLRQREIAQYARRKVIQIYPTRIEDPQLPAGFKK